MRIGWVPAGTASDSVTYFVDDRSVGADDEGFDRVLDLVERDRGPVTLAMSVVSTGSGSLDDDLPFRARLDELRARLGDRQLRYDMR